ncbi:hypothetical protein [Spirosoma agri]|uniref:Uncharacterized protein n=1 Tax=Spirosoma agri TaxID=1987381 RepID=A0A6M0IRM4_9BACT|nr:hypothetical protein [Spirosoma agri]NEU70968.1 hypothetical protein [Spirosoma agri]
MKNLLFTLIAGGLFTAGSSVAVAQVKASSQQIPVYETIKPIQLKIAPPRVFTNQTINLFDYPENSVLYVLNGKETVDKAEFMRRIKQAKSGIVANRVVVGPADSNQKRTIEIDYVVR